MAPCRWRRSHFREKLQRHKGPSLHPYYGFRNTNMCLIKIHFVLASARGWRDYEGVSQIAKGLNFLAMDFHFWLLNFCKPPKPPSLEFLPWKELQFKLRAGGPVQGDFTSCNGNFEIVNTNIYTNTDTNTNTNTDTNTYTNTKLEDLSGGSLVDSPTQLVCIWIFICWVGGGNPCGVADFCIGDSCRNKK